MRPSPGLASLYRLALLGVLAAAGFSPPGVARAQVWGFADLHGHQFTSLGFGGVMFWGEPFAPAGGIAEALPRCDFAPDTFPIMDGTAVPTTGCPPCNPGSCALCFRVPVHGPFGLGDVIGGALRDHGLGHGVHGYPDFDGWPAWDSFTHQQMYYSWLQRAWQGGLRLMVMPALNNEVLCGFVHHRPGFGCNDMDAVDREIAGARALEAYIDELNGGPGQGWYRIVESASEAREVAEGGNLAVVLGIEVSNLFGCDQGTCTEAYVAERLQHYYDLGVRHVFPVHEFDNDFAGASIWKDFFNYGTRIATGSYLDPLDCADAGYEFRLGAPPAAIATLIDLLFPDLLPPAYPGAAHCNSRGLTPLGEFLVGDMMDHHMIVDVDHMSAQALEDTLDLAEARGYAAVVAGHADMLDTTVGVARSEQRRTAAEVDRIRDVGGLIGLIPHANAAAITQPFGGRVANDCGGSSKAFAQTYLYTVDRLQGGAVALGTDFNGFAAHVAPRFGSDACAGEETCVDGSGDPVTCPQTSPVVYPFPRHGIPGMLDRHVVGSRTFDYNTDGLAHVGLLPDFIEDLQRVGLGDADLLPLFQSAEAYIAMWARAECDGCDDGDSCTVDECTGRGCVHTRAADDARCASDLNPCTRDVCYRGLCTHPATRGGDCKADFNPCTRDVCLDGECTHPLRADGSPCANSDVCTVDDTCHRGVCLDGGPLACEDGNPCTDDECSAPSGCRYVPVAGRRCDDGDPETCSDVCSAGGVCVGTHCVTTTTSSTTSTSVTTATRPPTTSTTERTSTTTTSSATVPTTTAPTSTTTTTGTTVTVTTTTTTTTGSLPTSTTRTVPPASTSSTTVPSPSACDPGDPGACRDADPCTVDRCIAGVGCRNDPATGAGAVRCLVEGGAAAACRDVPMPPPIARRIDAAYALVEEAAATGGRAARVLVLKAARLLKQAGGLAAAAGRQHRIPRACAADLRRRLADARRRTQEIAAELASGRPQPAHDHRTYGVSTPNNQEESS